MILVIDYGMGNVGSIMNMLKKIGAKSAITTNPDELYTAEKIILPGVGSFDKGMQYLEQKGFHEAILKNVVELKKPLLGICLGMQMLGRKSEEGVRPGLGLIPFDTVRFRFDQKTSLKVPHMGWNYVNINNHNSQLVNNICEKQRFYFVHTYHALCDNKEDILMESHYGYVFTAAVQHLNIYGTQFHPEKSHRYGMQLLSNFAKEC